MAGTYHGVHGDSLVCLTQWFPGCESEALRVSEELFKSASQSEERLRANVARLRPTRAERSPRRRSVGHVSLPGADAPGSARCLLVDWLDLVPACGAAGCASVPPPELISSSAGVRCPRLCRAHPLQVWDT
ncbi:hypothetical protein AAFF_G00387550 [Aldrovandia affinis]|uniref:Uncharacterized protein n=1 Tax=Aldrovandia affinis TaxID=143900 RepID=A0AAD7WLI0_9TELE|nr:hypothetical protein AAFF_G00387550 [Aldrovandia affinis]